MRKSQHLPKANSGFTLVELMISATLATLMSFGVLSIYVNQSSTISSETQRDSTAQEAQRAFDIMSRLLRQAQRNSFIVINNTRNSDTQPEVASDASNVQFTLPANQSIWPNVSGGPNNAILLSWNNSSESEKYKIKIDNAATIGALNVDNADVLAGGNSGSLARVINMDFWPLSGPRSLQVAASDPGTNGYLLRITTRAAEPDLSYIHPDASDANKHYRTYTVSGVISPRN